MAASEVLWPSPSSEQWLAGILSPENNLLCAPGVAPNVGFGSSANFSSRGIWCGGKAFAELPREHCLAMEWPSAGLVWGPPDFPLDELTIGFAGTPSFHFLPARRAGTLGVIAGASGLDEPRLRMGCFSAIVALALSVSGLLVASTFVFTGRRRSMSPFGPASEEDDSDRNHSPHPQNCCRTELFRDVTCSGLAVVYIIII